MAQSNKENIEVIVFGKVGCELCEKLALSLERVVNSKSIQNISGAKVSFRATKALSPDTVLEQTQDKIEEQRCLYAEMGFYDAMALPAVIVKNGHVLLRKVSITDLRDVTGGEIRKVITNAVGGEPRATSVKDLQCAQAVPAEKQAGRTACVSECSL